nr:IS200/IS605 family transposase [Bacteroidota bacterium]
MSYVSIYVHCVWGTKKRYPFLKGQTLSVVVDHIVENATMKGIVIKKINGHDEHIHCLISLKADQSILQVMQLIKGEASFWINKNNVTTSKFEWADEYYAVSVSESQVSNVKAYINNQQIHHQKVTWEDEYQKFIKYYGFEVIKG